MKKIFVLMPFHKDYENVYYVLEKIATGKLNANISRADKDVVFTDINENIRKSIEESDLLVADITEPNPNVYFEIGYAKALHKPIFFIAEEIAGKPFDVKTFPIYEYGKKPINSGNLEKELSPRLLDYFNSAIDKAILREPISEILSSVDKLDNQEDLFSKLVKKTLDETVQKSRQWINGIIEVSPENAIEKGKFIFQQLDIGGFATYLVQLSNYWDNNTDYIEESRKAARKENIQIERAYILASSEILFSKDLRKQIEEDNRANISTYIALSREVLSVNSDAVKDFGIWDEEVLCHIESTLIDNINQVTGCTFSRNKNNLLKAKTWKKSIMNVSKPTNVVFNNLDKLNINQALLLESSSKMFDISKDNCKGSYLNHNNCRWYHSAWQYLRYLDLVSTPDRHKKFYQEYIKKVSKEKNKILICGLADYGMLQQIILGLSKEKLHDIDITILDLCRTPLEISDWFARKYKIDTKVHSIQADVLNFHGHEGRYDFIFTDAFLTRFEEREKRLVVCAWNKLLKSGGIVATTARLRNGTRGINAIASQNEMTYFVESAIEEARHRDLIFLSETEIRKLATDYAKNITSYPFLKIEEIQSLFVENSFEVIEIPVEHVKGEFQKTTPYARIAARKLG